MRKAWCSVPAVVRTFSAPGFPSITSPMARDAERHCGIAYGPAGEQHQRPHAGEHRASSARPVIWRGGRAKDPAASRTNPPPRAASGWLLYINSVPAGGAPGAAVCPGSACLQLPEERGARSGPAASCSLLCLPGPAPSGRRRGRPRATRFPARRISLGLRCATDDAERGRCGPDNVPPPHCQGPVPDWMPRKASRRPSLPHPA